MESYFSFETAAAGSDRWRERMFWKRESHEYPLEWERHRVQIINERAIAFHVNNTYLITTNNGESWSEWSTDKLKTSTPGYIDGVKIGSDGTGHMVVSYRTFRPALEHLRHLSTNNFGVHWSMTNRDPDQINGAPFTEMTTEVTQALTTGGLPAAARLVGSYRADERHIPCCLGGLRMESQWSHAIALARVIAPPLAQVDGYGISTTYKFGVIETFKGTLQAGDTLSFVVRGGMVRFADGTSAEVVGAASTMKLNQECVLYLDEGINHFYPRHIFEIRPDDTVHVELNLSDEARSLNGLAREEFLDKVRASLQ